MSLGWLTESALIPKEPKPITGVSSSSLLSLQAIVYERESRGQLPSAKKRRLAAEKAARNEGVEARMAKDEQAAIAQTPEGAKAKLKEKARLYDEIKAGRAKSKGALVDFARKRAENGEEPVPGEEDDEEGEEPMPASLQASLQARSVAVAPPHCLSAGQVVGHAQAPTAVGIANGGLYDIDPRDLTTSASRWAPGLPCTVPPVVDDAQARAAQVLQEVVFDLGVALTPSATSSAPAPEPELHPSGMSMAAARPMLARWERGNTSAEDMAHKDRIHDEAEQRRATVGQERRQAREAVRGRLQALREAKSAAAAATGAAATGS